MTTTTHDTSAALEAAIDAHGANASGARTALHRAITAHVEAEVARRLAAAPGGRWARMWWGRSSRCWTA